MEFFVFYMYALFPFILSFYLFPLLVGAPVVGLFNRLRAVEDRKRRQHDQRDRFLSMDNILRKEIPDNSWPWYSISSISKRLLP